MQSLKINTDNLKEELENCENTVSSLRQQLSTRDEQLADAQEQLFLLRTGKGQMSGVTRRHQEEGDESLSPETKHNISHLKAQLRKAHAGMKALIF